MAQELTVLYRGVAIYMRTNHIQVFKLLYIFPSVFAYPKIPISTLMRTTLILPWDLCYKTIETSHEYQRCIAIIA